MTYSHKKERFAKPPHEAQSDNFMAKFAHIHPYVTHPQSASYAPIHARTGTYRVVLPPPSYASIYVTDIYAHCLNCYPQGTGEFRMSSKDNNYYPEAKIWGSEANSHNKNSIPTPNKGVHYVHK
jgi:hypothetical protein